MSLGSFGIVITTSLFFKYIKMWKLSKKYQNSSSKAGQQLRYLLTKFSVGEIEIVKLILMLNEFTLFSEGDEKRRL